MNDISPRKAALSLSLPHPCDQIH